MSWKPFIKASTDGGGSMAVEVDGITILGDGTLGAPLGAVNRSKQTHYDGVLTLSNGTDFWSDTPNLGQGLRAKVTYVTLDPDPQGRYAVEVEFIAAAYNVNGIYGKGNFQILFDDNTWMPLADDTSPVEPYGNIAGSIVQGPTPFDSDAVAAMTGHAVRNGGAGAAAGFVFHCVSHANTASGNKILSIAKIAYNTLEAP
jgi:hypothetical protein